MDINNVLQQHGIGARKKIAIGNSKPSYDEVASVAITSSSYGEKAKLNNSTQQCLIVDYNSGTTVYSLKVTDANLATLRTISTVAGAAYQAVGLGNDGAVYWNDNLPNLTKWDNTGAKVLNAVGLERMRDSSQGLQFSDDGLRFYGCPTSFYWREYNTATGAMNRTVNITASATYCWCCFYDKVSGKLYGVTDANKLEEVDVATWTIPRTAAGTLVNAANVLASQNFVWVVNASSVQIFNKSTLALVKTVSMGTIINPTKCMVDYTGDIIYFATTGTLNAMNGAGEVIFSLAGAGEAAIMGVFTNKELLTSNSSGGTTVKRRKYYTKVLK